MAARLDGYQCKLAITRERQRFSKIHESNRDIFTWRSCSCLRCGVEVNTVPGDRMNEWMKSPSSYRYGSIRGGCKTIRRHHNRLWIVIGLLTVRSYDSVKYWLLVKLIKLVRYTIGSFQRCALLVMHKWQLWCDFNRLFVVLQPGFSWLFVVLVGYLWLLVVLAGY